MKYMCLIYNSPTSGPQSDEDFATAMPQWWAFNDKVEQGGQLIAGDALCPVETATTVQVRDGSTITIDGPFAETKEYLGGYYLLDCADLDEAIALAAEILVAKYGSIEVRPLMDIPQPE